MTAAGYLAGIRQVMYGLDPGLIVAEQLAAERRAEYRAEVEDRAQAELNELIGLFLFCVPPSDPALADWCPWGDPAEPGRLAALVKTRIGDYRLSFEELADLADDFAGAAS